MVKNYKVILLIILNILSVSQLYSRDEIKLFRIGIDYGIGKQPFFPFSSPDYSYKVNGYKILFNYHIKKKDKICFELQIEPGIYSARHRLLNEYFIKSDQGLNYLEQRELYKKEKTITEYALNIGFQIRYELKHNLSLSLLGSTGPMYSDTATERLAKGFAFSDIVALGIGWRAGNIMFEIKPGLRHVSNANLKHPNSGHNSSNIDFSISFYL